MILFHKLFNSAMDIPYLTKSRYLAGLQCTRRLWLQMNDPPSYEAPATGPIMDMGREIGVKARLLFPGGVLVDVEPWQHEDAITETNRLMGNPKIRAIFEAAFTYDETRIRIDIMQRHDNGTWGLIEVKSSTGLKDHYIDDIALQIYVLEGLGIPTSSIELLHVNTAYVRGTAGIDWGRFFATVDVFEEVRKALPKIPSDIVAIRNGLASTTLPYATPGSQCKTPYTCEFWDRCTQHKPDDWVKKLPRLSARQAEELVALGIESIAAIPPDFRLTSKQAIIRDATASGVPFVAPVARQLGWPVCGDYDGR